MARRCVLLAVIAVLFAGCGFHLQGHAPLPATIAVVYVDAKDRESDFYRALRQVLMAAGARLVEEPGEHVARLRILADAAVDRTVAVSTLNVPTEYEVTYTVRFAVERDGAELIAPEQRALSRHYSYNETEQLAKQRERAILSDALARDLASVVLRRLTSL